MQGYWRGTLYSIEEIINKLKAANLLTTGIDA